jgi:hypothetical protein
VNIKLAPKFWAERHKTPKFSGVLPFCMPMPKYSVIKLSFMEQKYKVLVGFSSFLFAFR